MSNGQHCPLADNLASADPRSPSFVAAGQRLFLPVILGGMGLFSCVRNMDAALLGSALLTCDLVRELRGDASPAPTVADDIPYVLEHRAALERVRASVPGSVELQQWTYQSLFEKGVPDRQQFIAEELANVACADILRSFDVSTTEGTARYKAFVECGALKAGSWVTAGALDYHSRLTNGEWFLSAAARQGINPYPEVSPHAICRSCNHPIGPDVVDHANHCDSCRRRAQALRHTVVKTSTIIIERKSEHGTYVTPEPFVQAIFGGPDCMPPSSPAFIRSRADLYVRTPGGASYIVDVTIIDATRDPSPAATYVMGAATELAQHEKMVQYKTRFPRLDVPSQLRVAAFDVRGGISTGTYAYFQEIIARESASKPSTPKSVIANRVYSRFSVSVQRSIANNIMEFRYGQVPAQLVVGAGA